MRSATGRWDIVRIGALLTIAYLLYLARSVLPPFIIAGVLAYLLGPLVERFQRHLRLPRAVAILSTLLLVFGPLVVALTILAPFLIGETRALIVGGPAILGNVLTQILGGRQVVLLGQTVQTEVVVSRILIYLVGWLGTPAEAVHLIALMIESLLGIFVTFVVLFYMLLNPTQISTFALDLLPPEERPRARHIAAESNAILRRYLGGLLVLIILMAAMTWLGLHLLFRLPYALPIAVATGILEMVPILGPIIAGTLAVVVALAHGGLGAAIGVVALYFVLRQIEDQLFMPLVISQTVQLHPVTTIFSVLAGGAIAGILGLLLAVPVVVVLNVIRKSVLAEPAEPRPPE